MKTPTKIGRYQTLAICRLLEAPSADDFGYLRFNSGMATSQQTTFDSDGLTKPSAKESKRTRSQRGTSIRKSGGRPGYKGTTLKQVKNPDKITDHFPPQCQAYQSALSPEELMRSAARQVFDLPPPPPLVVTEQRAHTCQCHHCGAQTRAAFPKDVPPLSMAMELRLWPPICRLCTASPRSA